MIQISFYYQTYSAVIIKMFAMFVGLRTENDVVSLIVVYHLIGITNKEFVL